MGHSLLKNWKTGSLENWKFGKLPSLTLFLW